MAIAIPLGDRLSLRVSVGTDPESVDHIMRTRGYSNVKPDASDDDLFNIANQMVELSDDSMPPATGADIQRIKTVSLQD